jgi:hypothetical protein
VRSITAKNIYHENGYYKIKLGNGSIHLFKSERKAQKYQHQVNRYLSDLCLSYNQLYSDLHQMYRELWPCFHTSNNSSSGQYLFQDRKIKEEFQQIENLLDLLTTSHTRQHCYLRIYRDFELIHESIISIYTNINAVIQSKSIKFISAKLDIYLHQTISYQKELEEFSTKATNHKTEIDRSAAALKFSLNYSQTA